MRRYNEEAMTDPERISLMLSKEVGVLSKKKKRAEAANGRKSSKWEVGLGLQMWGEQISLKDYKETEFGGTVR